MSPEETNLEGNQPDDARPLQRRRSEGPQPPEGTGVDRPKPLEDSGSGEPESSEEVSAPEEADGDQENEGPTSVETEVAGTETADHPPSKSTPMADADQEDIRTDPKKTAKEIKRAKRNIPGWASGPIGHNFEAQLYQEYCIYTLLGEDARLEPGAIRKIHLQDRKPQVDDLVVYFESGVCWAFQAKAGLIGLHWSPGEPFADGLVQLYLGANDDQVKCVPGSLDRLILAVDHSAPSTVQKFQRLLTRIHNCHDRSQFFDEADDQEKEWLQKLDGLIQKLDDSLTSKAVDVWLFLKHLYIQQLPHPETWKQNMDQLLEVRGTLPEDRVKIFQALNDVISNASESRGIVDYKTLAEACEHIPSLPGRADPPFQLFSKPTEERLCEALRLPSVRPVRFIERPELVPIPAAAQVVLVTGRPGSGKSQTLIQLALDRPGWAVVVMTPEFVADHYYRLSAALRMVEGPCLVLWDDIHDRTPLFANTVPKIVALQKPIRVLAAFRTLRQAGVTGHLTPEFWRKADVEYVEANLNSFETEQANEMAQVVVETWGLQLDEATCAILAYHIQKGDGGPFFALRLGRLLKRIQDDGRSIDAGDVAQLPVELQEIWETAYKELSLRTDSPQVLLLRVLRFLHKVKCPLRVDLAKLLYRHITGHLAGFADAARRLVQDAWVRKDDRQFVVHDVTMKAVPMEQDDSDFQSWVGLARAKVSGDEFTLEPLRTHLASYYVQLSDDLEEEAEEEERKEYKEIAKDLISLAHEARGELGLPTDDLSAMVGLIDSLLRNVPIFPDQRGQSGISLERFYELQMSLRQTQNTAERTLDLAKSAKDSADRNRQEIQAAQEILGDLQQTVQETQKTTAAACDQIQKQVERTQKSVQAIQDAAQIAAQASETSRKSAENVEASVRLAQKSATTVRYAVLTNARLTDTVRKSVDLVEQTVKGTEAAIQACHKAIDTLRSSLPSPAPPPTGIRSRLPVSLSILIVAAAILILALCLLWLGPVSDRKATPTPTPPIAPTPTVVGALRISTGCGQTHTAGTILPIVIEAGVADRVYVYAIDPEGQQTYVVDQDIQAGQSFRHNWPIPAIEGSWTLLAHLSNTEACAQCSFAVKSRIEPTGTPEGDSQSQGLCDIYNPALPGGTAEELGIDVMYNFVDRAPDATWIFYTPGPQTVDFAEASNWPLTYTLGGVHLHTNVLLEDGQRYPTVLETHPPHMPFGEIWGKYNLGSYNIQDGDFFLARVGFLQGAYQGDAVFKVHFQNTKLDTPVTVVASLSDRYDWQEDTEAKIKCVEVPLSAKLGSGFIYLEVDAGPTVFQDQAIWVQAQIVRLQ